MHTSELSTIAQLLCFGELPVNFAKLVGELDTVLDRLRGVPHKVTWDCDDVATFDLPGTRILLGWSESPGRGLHGILTLSVGPSPVDAIGGAKPDHSLLCSRLVERVQEQVHAPNVLWHQIACLMTAEWVDLLIEAMPDAPGFTQEAEVPADLDATDPDTGVSTPIKTVTSKTPDDHKPTETSAADQTSAKVKPRNPGKTKSRSKAGSMPDLQPANSQPDLPRRPQDEDLSRLRDALYGEEDASLSVPMRLAVHAMNATLIVVWLPLGVTVMAAGIVKGEDMRLASRMMVLAGSVAALGQTSLGQQFAALGFF